MHDRRELAHSTARDRPWQHLVNRQALAEAVADGAALAGAVIGMELARSVVDRDLGIGVPAADVAAAVGWHDVLRFLAAAIADDRPVAVDEGLVRSLHWLLHRHLPAAAAGRLRPGADLRLPAPPVGADAIGAAIWTAAAIRRADPCWSGTVVVSHAVELLLLGEADGLAPWYAGRATPSGEPREVLQATAQRHLLECRRGEQRWFDIDQLLASRGLPKRMTGPCWDAAAGYRLTNTSYRAAVATARRRPTSEQQASRDLRTLVDADLLEPTGRTRDRSYRWSG